MTDRYTIDNQTLDGLDLKALLCRHGMHVPPALIRAFSRSSRLSRRDGAMNELILSGEVYVPLVRASRAFPSPFSLRMDVRQAMLHYRGQIIAPVEFPAAWALSCDAGDAYWSGADELVIPNLWSCEIPCLGRACLYCRYGLYWQAQFARDLSAPLPIPLEYAARIATQAASSKAALTVHLNGGMTFESMRERELILGAIALMDTASVVAHCAPPSKIPVLDEYMQAGIGRVAMDLQLWNKRAFAHFSPGKAAYIGHERYLQTLTYAAERYGPSRVSCNFILGLEPVEDFLEGAEELAQRGVTPTASVWFPFGPPKRESNPNPVDYPRVRRQLGEIYARHGLTALPATSFALDVAPTPPTTRPDRS